MRKVSEAKRAKTETNVKNRLLAKTEMPERVDHPLVSAVTVTPSANVQGSAGPSIANASRGRTFREAPPTFVGGVGRSTFVLTSFIWV